VLLGGDDFDGRSHTIEKCGIQSVCRSDKHRISPSRGRKLLAFCPWLAREIHLSVVEGENVSREKPLLRSTNRFAALCEKCLAPRFVGSLEAGRLVG
jgi:hypothetical protein